MPLQFARRAISLRSWSSREVWKRCRKPLQRYTEGAEPLALALNLREPASAELAVKQILDRYGRIDALINVAGAVLQTDLFAMIDAEWNDGLSLKFHDARRLTINAWEALKSARGAVVLTSGATALAPKAALAAVGTINAAIAVRSEKAFASQAVCRDISS